MMLKWCAGSIEKGYTHFSNGGGAGVADELKQLCKHGFRA
jgi:hypothetical protein